MGVVRRARMARVCLARERRACGERGEFGASRARACTERAGRRTPCAERAVILSAVQSLRLASAEGENGEGVSREGGKGLGGEGRLGKTPEGQGDRALRGLSIRGATQEDRPLAVSIMERFIQLGENP
jgi:hypothetical protein